MKKITEFCTGCSSCMAVCPTKAIRMNTNEYAVTEAVIDEEQCINCKKCVNICPEQVAVTLTYPKACYAAYALDNQDYNSTSSGGVATVLSRYILHINGIVYGAAYNGNGLVEHIRVENEKELERLKGSKYVQSQMNDIYSSILADLYSGKIVLFIGTPCQIAGVKKFTREKYAKQLYTIDLICHGTPPTKYLQEYLKEIAGSKYDAIKDISFRKKDYKMTVKDCFDNIVYEQKAGYDLYFKAFQEGLTYRENCYNCRYARPERCSDITIGDFWGLNKKEVKNVPEYISCILTNTERGNLLLDNIKDRIIRHERPIKEAINGNTNLRRPSEHHKDEKIFRKKYVETNGFSKALQYTTIPRHIKKTKMRDVVLKPYRIIKTIFR